MSLIDSENMPHKCRIQLRVRTSDIYGGSKDTPSTVITNVPCWEQLASSNEITAFAKRGMSIDRKIFFPSNPNVTNQHQIVITERNGEPVATADEIELEVKSIGKPNNAAGFDILWKVMANENTGGDD